LNVIRLLHFNMYPDAQEPSSSAAPAHDNAAAASAAAAAASAADAEDDDRAECPPAAKRRVSAEPEEPLFCESVSHYKLLSCTAQSKLDR
jgi:hypothetical protein